MSKGGSSPWWGMWIPLPSLLLQPKGLGGGCEINLFHKRKFYSHVSYTQMTYILNTLLPASLMLPWSKRSHLSLVTATASKRPELRRTASHRSHRDPPGVQICQLTPVPETSRRLPRATPAWPSQDPLPPPPLKSFTQAPTPRLLATPGSCGNQTLGFCTDGLTT